MCVGGAGGALFPDSIYFDWAQKGVPNHWSRILVTGAMCVGGRGVAFPGILSLQGYFFTCDVMVLSGDSDGVVRAILRGNIVVLIRTRTRYGA